MEKVVRYKAFDGREFNSETECLEHEEISNEIQMVVSELPTLLPEYGRCDFVGGAGYIQHDKDRFMRVRVKLCEIANKIYEHQAFTQTIEKGMKADSDWAGRIIAEIPNKTLRSAWHRISCTDSQFREWGQLYFTNNPDKGTQVRLN